MLRTLLWFCAGFLFLGIDLLLPHMVLLFFGIGALAAAILSLLGASPTVELVTFSVVSVTTLVLFRRVLQRVFSGRSVQKSPDAAKHPLLGRRGVVSRAIVPNAEGEIRIDGSFWRASADVEIAEGTPVEVTSIAHENDLTLIVSPKRASAQ